MAEEKTRYSHSYIGEGAKRVDVRVPIVEEPGLPRAGEEDTYVGMYGTQNTAALRDIARIWSDLRNAGEHNEQGNYGGLVSQASQEVSVRYGIPLNEAQYTFSALDLDQGIVEMRERLTPADFIRLSREFRSGDPARIDQAAEEWRRTTGNI